MAEANKKNESKSDGDAANEEPKTPQKKDKSIKKIANLF